MSSLVKTTGMVGGLTLVSRISGFLRDMVVAAMFGAAAGTDAFFVAFKIPNFLRRLFAEGAFSQALIPVLAEVRAEGGTPALRVFVGNMAGTGVGLLLLLCFGGVVAAPLLVTLFAPGFVSDPAKFQLATDMLRWMFPYVGLIALTALAGSILNTLGCFAVPALTPLLLNLCLIAGVFWLAPVLQVPIMALAVAVFVAGVVQLGFQIPFLWRVDMLPRSRWAWRDSRMRQVMRLMGPGILGSSVAQINLFIDMLVASFLATGSVSWLYYSDRLVEFPLGIFAVAIGTVILPRLSTQHAEAEPRAFSRTLDWALRVVCVFGAPAAVALFFLAGPLLAPLFYYGEFSAHDVHMSAWSLMAFSLGLLPFMLIRVLTPGFFARQDTVTPMRIGLVAVVVNIALTVLVVVPLVWLGWSAMHVGLALATSVAAIVNAGYLLRGLRRIGVYVPMPGWWRLGGQIVVGNGVMALVLWNLGGVDLDVWLDRTAQERMAWLSAVVVAGGASYVCSLWLAGLRGAALRALWRPMLKD